MIHFKMAHSSHAEHEFKLELTKGAYKCDGCKEVGFHTRYTCKEPSCNLHFHKDCAYPTPTLSHLFSPKSAFDFLESIPRGHTCDACAKSIEGYVYHDFKRGWDLHPTCAALPLVKEVGEVTLMLQRKVRSECDECGRKEFRKGKKSWSYVSTCGKCHFHVACVKEMLTGDWDKEGGLCKSGGEMGIALVEHKKNSMVECKNSELHLAVIDKEKKIKNRKFVKFMKILKMVIPFIISAVVGDPTSMVVALVTYLIYN